MSYGRRASAKVVPTPVETPSSKVRKEWKNFLSSWYEPEKKKLEEELQKELTTKFKKVKTQVQRKARDEEKEKRTNEIKEGLAEPARHEWEERLEKSNLTEEQWTDITDKEQEEVIAVFSGLFRDEENEEEEESNATATSTDEDNVAFEEIAREVLQQHKANEPATLTPTAGTFEFVSPTSFYSERTTPSHSAKGLPPLYPDLADTLSGFDESNHHTHASGSGSSGAPSGAPSIKSNGWGFSGWAAEAGLISEPAKKPSATAAETRPSAADKMTRQSSAASNHPSRNSPQTIFDNSSPYTTTRSPPTATEKLSPGKQYIGPVLLDEDALRSEDEAFMNFKTDLRIQMIDEFHREAIPIEAELVRSLVVPGLSKELQRKLVQDHEQSMLLLRDEKETQRKMLVEMERQRRREDIFRRQKEVTQRSTRFVDKDVGNGARQPLKTVQMKQDKPSSHVASAFRSNVKPEENLREGILFSRSGSSDTYWDPRQNIKQEENQKTVQTKQDKPTASAFRSNIKPEENLREGILFSRSGSSDTYWDPRQNIKQEESQKDGILFSRSTSSDASSTPGIRGILKKSNNYRAPEPAPVEVEIAPVIAPVVAPIVAPVVALPDVPAETPKGKKGKKGQNAKQQAKKADVVEKPAVTVPPPVVPAAPKPVVNGKLGGKNNQAPTAQKPVNGAQNQAMAGPSKVNKTATAKSMKATVEDIVEETDDEWSKIPVEEAEPVPEITSDDIDGDDSGEASWYGAGEGGYWSSMAEGGTIPEASSEQEPKHVRWMPPSMVSDVEPRFTPNAAANMFDAGEGDDMEREVFYYALSGGAFTTNGFSAPGVPSYPEDDQTESPGIDFSSAFQAGFPDFGNKGQKSEDVKPVVGKGKGKEKSRQESSFGAKKAQETPWPSMETWMSASSRMGGQSSGSARFL